MAPAADGTAGPLTKRTLVAVSHAIERAALAPAADSPAVVLALFQRLPYFERERSVYAELADRAVTVVGLVPDFRPELPPGVVPVELRAGEPLAREWAVVLLTPHSGAYLTAVDLEQVVPGEATLESGRLFDGQWGFRRDEAVGQLHRYRHSLANRLDPATVAGIDRVLDAARVAPSAAAETRADAGLRLLAAEMERARRHSLRLAERLDDVAAGGDRDPATHLHTERFLRRWTGLTGTTSAGTLPLGLVLLRVEGLAALDQDHGHRAADQALRSTVAALSRSLGPVDRAARLGAEDFLLVLPGGTEERTAELATGVVAELRQLGDTYPFVPLPVTAAVLVTRDRPLPLDRLRETVVWARGEGHPVAAA